MRKYSDQNKTWFLLSVTLSLSLPLGLMVTDQDALQGFEQKLKQRQNVAPANPLTTIPKNAVNQPHGRIPNTPLAASMISFILGSMFAVGFLAFLNGGFGHWWATYQLGFFIASWAAFHWGEFAVTAGWNLDKCSIDCKCVSKLVLRVLMSRYSFPVREWQLISRRTWRCSNGISNYELF